MTTTWFVAHDADGSISRVIRILEDPDGLRGEYLQDGIWVHDDVVVQVMGDDTWGSPVSIDEGEKVARDLGATN